MHAYANPARFVRLSHVMAPWGAGVTVVAFIVGLYLSLFASPVDYQQGQTVRIMYIHVPAAWMAMAMYASMAMASAAGFIWRHPVADLACKAMAPIGAAFTFVCLVTGSLWGQPMWGTWWVWDARLTSVLILFFMYLGYMVLVEAFDDPQRGLKSGAILVLVGVINLPIIKFSVDWWNTLHQPASVSRLGAPAVDGSMLAPLLVMALAFTMLFVCLALVRTHSEILRRKIQVLRALQARPAKPVATAAAPPLSAE